MWVFGCHVCGGVIWEGMNFRFEGLGVLDVYGCECMTFLFKVYTLAELDNA